MNIREAQLLGYLFKEAGIATAGVFSSNSVSPPDMTQPPIDNDLQRLRQRLSRIRMLGWGPNEGTPEHPQLGFDRIRMGNYGPNEGTPGHPKLGFGKIRLGNGSSGKLSLGKIKPIA